MFFDRRAFLLACSASAAIPVRVVARTGSLLRPEDFGAKGDGKTNDTKAFSRLSAQVNRRGGGTVVLTAGRTYIVGAQSRDTEGRFGWNPEPVLDFEGLTAPLTIVGNGARLRCQSGLRYGTFDRASGVRVDRQMPNLKRSEIATPYMAMITARKCKSSVTIRDIELDGAVEKLVIGGRFGDKGRQIPAYGLMLRHNSGSEVVENVLSHHHALDGAAVIGLSERSLRSKISRLVCRDNGRQGLSITAGRGYDLADCEFSRTGRTGLHSAPGAGVDIEAENALIRDLSFTRCKFLDNTGCGMTAPVGNSAEVQFDDCLFVGTTSWSAWPNKPAFVFTDCTFVGALVHAYGDPDPKRATRFIRCRLTDDPALSPTGKVYAGTRGMLPIASLIGENVLFESCVFDLVGTTLLPRTPPSVIYRDCRMSQRSTRKAATRGRFFGKTTITGPVALNGSMVEGTLILNGRQIARGKVGPGR